MGNEMKVRRRPTLIFATVGLLSMGLALPVLGQQGPESLLPPGFGDPAPPPAKPTPQPSSTPSGASPATGSAPKSSTGASPAASTAKKSEDESGEEEETEIRYDVPPTARRSLKQVGVVSENSGGFPAAAYGGIDGSFLRNAANHIKGPLASRWGTIMTRRLLASRTDTPRGVNGADWVGDRGWLLLRMGDAVVARQLIQQVDSGNFTPRLLNAALPIYLANADLSGMCPVAEGGSQRTTNPQWKLALAVCASLSGEQGRATSLLNQAKGKKWGNSIDLLFVEKAVGAGTEGRRNVKIEWERVTNFSTLRHGLAQATGLEPPERLYAQLGHQVDGWRAQLPTVSNKAKVAVAPGAAALGVISNRAMVDIYSLAAEDSDTEDTIKAKTDLLQQAFVGGTDSARVSAMTSLWNGAANPRELHGLMVLTARTAATIAPGDGNDGEADRLIMSMLTSGFDEQAARWRSAVSEGSLGWALLAAGSPEWESTIDKDAVEDFQGNDDSENYHKTALLAAGLGGLGRASAETVNGLSESLEINLAKQSNWSRAIAAAAERGESGTVVLLAAAGLQGESWQHIPAHHLYHMVRALKQVGLDAEARMLVAEAVSFG
jgi:hypothetical protein